MAIVQDMYTKTCNVYDKQQVTKKGNYVYQYTQIHTDAPCYLRGDNTNYKDWETARQEDVRDYTLYIQWDKTDIRRGMNVIVTEPVTWHELWRFVIMDIQFFEWKWQIDHIQARVKTEDFTT